MQNKTHNDFIIKTSIYGDKTILYAYLGSESIVTVPEGVTDINFFAFAEEHKPNGTITKIILPDSVSNIEQNAFAFCRALTEVRWPNNKDFKIMCGHIFKRCSSLKKITIPPSITSIASFLMPQSLQTVEIHDDLILVEQASFTYEDVLRDDFNYYNSDTVKILLSNPNYKIIDGFMVNQKHKIALFYLDRNKTEVHVPDGIESLSPLCFDEYGYFECGHTENAYRKTKLVPIERIIIPESVKRIADGAFFYCKNLKLVFFRGKSSQIKIESEALDECNSEAKIICSDTKLDEKKFRVTNLKIERLIIIHKAIKNGTFPNTNELRDLCRSCLGFEKLSTATISRDIEFLRTRFNAPIEYDSFENGYYYKKDFEFKF